jgi:hypothetical protein
VVPVPTYELTFMKEISQGSVTLFIRSEVNMNAPFNTERKINSFPS